MTDMSTASAQPDCLRRVANRDKVLMLAATAARMGVALVGFVIMARSLGPEHFGVIATAAAYGGFTSIATDFGLTVSALRTAAADPTRAEEILSDAIATKLVLSLAAAVVGLAAALFILPIGQVGVYAMVFAGVLAYAFADLAMVAARARRRFDVETTVVLTTSILILLTVSGTAVVTRNLGATAAAFMLSRFVYLAVTQVAMKRWLNIAISWRRPLSRIIHTGRQSASYAADAILTSLSSQIDVLLFAALLTVHDIGIYQAGARLVQVIMPFATMLSTVYMPVLAFAAIKGQRNSFRDNARRINIEFCALAIAAALGFVFVGPLATRLVYGPSYDSLIPLWSGFGVFALLRLMASSYGIQLAAIGFVRTRILAQISSITLFGLSAWLVSPHFSLSLTSWILALSSLPVLMVFAFALIRANRADTSHFATFALTLSVSIAIVLV